MQGILKNKNIKSIKTVMQDDNIVIEMKLKNSITDMSKFAVFSAIFDLDNFVKSVFIDNNGDDYLKADNDIYNYELLTINDKTSELMLFSLVYNFILSFKNDKIHYSYYGYYDKKNYQ